MYDSAKWKRLRQVVMRRDGYLCQECKRYGKRKPGTEVHHVNPVKEHPELALDSWNLILLCSACHNKMEDRSSGQLTVHGEMLRERVNRKHQR